MRSRSALLVALSMTIPFALACPGLGDGEGGTVPGEPTYVDHVQAIMVEHCTECHAPGGDQEGLGFDLGAYASIATSFTGAFDMRCLVVDRAVEGNPSFMPPEGAIPSVQRLTIERWVEQGARETAAQPLGSSGC